jgi:hypothetical protein
MSQPTPYTPSVDFSDYQDNNPGVDYLGTNFDTEFAAIELTFGQVLALSPRTRSTRRR